ncbi:MAG TPA: hypothetical protein VIL86_08570 [Tepidisphaeraceae bacterium]|jgi:hypothetical protein
MNKRLNDDDRRAIDLLLDSDSVNGIGFTAAASPDFQLRLQSAGRLLQLLEKMPAVDPPADLKNKTLRRLEEAAISSGARPTGPSTSTGINPVA